MYTHHNKIPYFAALSSFGEDLAPQLGCLYAAIYLHKQLLFNVLRAPNSFFEITPTGRLLSRFSKDIDVVDLALPQQISDTIYCSFEVNELMA